MLHVPEILTAEELSFVRAEIDSAEFVEGKLTAKGAAKNVKNNQQLSRHDEGKAKDLDAVLITALLRHSLVQAWACPAAVTAPLINRHAQGMHYGFHVDAAVTTQPNPLRRDLSVTIFLDDPDTYDGGELEVESPAGLKQIKLKAGDGFIYQTNAMHQVREVTQGVRHAAIIWLQSLIQDDALRLSLFDLHAAISGLQSKGVDGSELLLLNKVHQNLTRKFSQP